MAKGRWLCVGLALLAAMGCGYNQRPAPEGYTRVHFGSPLPLDLSKSFLPRSLLTGGVFIMANRTNGSFSTSFRFTDELTPQSRVLPNGAYDFNALGFIGSELGSGGDARCGKSALQLSGGNVSVNLSLSEANCLQSPFTNANFQDGSLISTLYVQVCTFTSAGGVGGPHLSSETDFSVPPVCTHPSNAPWDVESVRIGYPLYISTAPGQVRDLPNGSPPLSDENSYCMEVPSGAGLTQISIPSGDGTALFPTKIVAYDATMCGGNVIETFVLPRGVSSNAGAIAIRANGSVKGTGGDVVRVFSDSPNSKDNRIFLGVGP